MEEKLRKYVEELFADAPKTSKMVELREEIFMNLKEKYNDLITAGASEEEAYRIVKGSVGDVNELINSANEAHTARVPSDEERKQRARLTAVAVMLYILSPVFIIALGSIHQEIMGLVFMFVLIAVATGLLVYRSSLQAAPDYEKLDDSMVEEFKEWQAENKRKKEKEKTYAGIVWPVIVALYFVISFTTWAWGITWIIFIIGAAVDQIIKLAIKQE